MNAELNRSFEAISEHLHRIFGSDQTSYALQQSDGSYRRKTGLVTPQFIVSNLHNKGSIAVYQKNNDQTVKWICYDFDILKHNLETDRFEPAKVELNRTVAMFCEYLDNFNIPYLLEFSGNRGFHIWVTFSECTDFQVAFFALQTIREKASLQYNSDLIGIDIFPSSRMPTGGVGKAVKIPLSKHTKSQYYSLLLRSIPHPLIPVGELNEELLNDQIEILSVHRSTTKAELETILNVFFPSSSIDSAYQHRIKAIYVESPGFSINELIDHWQTYLPLAQLSKNIVSQGHLNHYQRRLLVGMLGNVKCDGNITFSRDLLHELFSKHTNYNKEITDKELLAFSSYNFPTQEQIEEAVGLKFESKLLIAELLSACVPSFKSFLDATFDIALKDIEIVRASEINYLYANDEVQAKVVIDELTNRTAEELFVYATRIIQEPLRSGYYRHIRNEKTKNRTLITPDAATRITTSVILKQILYCLDTVSSGNSHGYKPNKGFAGGYIFKPWLYLWIKFVSNISSTIEDESNQQYFIVKTDISSFYDEIPHDNLKRLLLGGVNPRIDTKVGGLNSTSRKLYEDYIDALFRITEMMVGTKKGLPQGPAYARYLAELYLDNLDCKLESYLGTGTLFLYQRYVDDIFFVTSTELAAKEILEQLRQDLALLGLSLNPEKTIVSQICNFSDDFNHYRSQSKYAVDRASREFANATDTQKNLAINEFMILVKSDSCEEDLAFVFSHLTGVENVEPLKREKVLPTIESGTGRGSLYKHLFGFVLADPNNWYLLDSVIKFTELQSEVLTACLITELEENKGRNNLLARLAERLLGHLIITRLVEEHIAFMHISYGIKLNISSISARAFISCLAALNNGDNLQVTSALVSFLNTALNDLKDLDSFVCALYPLCNSVHLLPEDLNHLARTFYAKLANDEETGRLGADPNIVISNAATTSKYYYLICLFSLSDVNNSIPLLKSMWKCCIRLFNHYGISATAVVPPNWFAKIVNINLHQDKLQLIISTIIDGSIVRGVKDKYKVCESFYNNLLIFVAFQDDDLFRRRFEDALSTLRKFGLFYEWLADREGVSLFPNANDRQWFEKNVIENATIVLRKNNQILFRKPTKAFHPLSNPINNHMGYSELLETYQPDLLRSFAEVAASVDAKTFLNMILKIIANCKDVRKYPNIFTVAKIVKPDSWLPFTNELLSSNMLIFEDRGGKIQTFPNNAKNFIGCCLNTICAYETNDFIQRLNGKYLANLSDTFDVTEFLQYASDQLKDITEDINTFYFDLAAASAIFLMLEKLDPLNRIDKFVDQYHKINPKAADKHLYGVLSSREPKDANPIVMLETVRDSLQVIRIETFHTLAIFLDKDIKQYIDRLKTTADKVANQNNADYLTRFERADVKINHTGCEMAINGEKYPFSVVWLLNCVNEELIAFEPQHSTFINSSEHVYRLKFEKQVHILAIPHSVSKIYQSIIERFKVIKKRPQSSKSFPDKPVDIQSIKALPGFHSAAGVVAVHRELTRDVAEQILSNWLRYLPTELQHPFVELIRGHVCMDFTEIYKFNKVVKKIRTDTKLNPFLIKRPGDLSGTHRILQRDPELGRFLEQLSPFNLQQDSKNITIITDNLLSGTQITKALAYYATDGTIQNKDGYVLKNSEQTQRFREILKNVEVINICSVLYTTIGIAKIKKLFQVDYSKDIEVKVISGQDITKNAFFGTTVCIGEADKDTIRNVIKNGKTMGRLRTLLDVNSATKGFQFSSDEKIDNLNLVARYKTLPKGCFDFLHIGLRHDPTCHPFVQVRETYRMI